jgi:hypothetical protein
LSCRENVQDLTEQVDRQASLNGELASNATLLQSEVNETRGIKIVFITIIL